MKTEKLYQKIKNEIRLELGKYGPGEFVNTEVSLAAKYNVSRPTVRKAVDALVSEGVLKRIAGKGLVIPDDNNIPESHSKSILIVVNIQKEDVNLFSKSILGIIDYANETDFTYKIINQDDKEKRNQILREINFKSYAGAIVTAYGDGSDKEMINIIKSNNLPLVLIDNPLDKGIYNYVVADDYTGGYMIGEHLGKLGHKKIAFLSTVNPAKTVENRISGITDGLAAYGTKIDSKDIVRLTDEKEAEIYISKRISSGNFDYTAIACCNDIMALYVYKALTALGFNVPGDISITGFDGSLGEILSPVNFTTVNIPGYKMGYEAAQLLIDMVFKKTDGCKKRILDVEFKNGCTTAPVNG